ncbi:hypothetical protein GCM10010495_44970 [Kitasatospora herbaricolor]|nr:hypothetical protein GCM10010495_44970 [Kitasatospora herbaricolor]
MRGARGGSVRYRPQPEPIAADSPQVDAVRRHRSFGSPAVARALTPTAGAERVDLDSEAGR